MKCKILNHTKRKKPYAGIGKIIKRTKMCLFQDEAGMGVIEVILIIVVLVGLALIFKNQITSIATSLFTLIRTEISHF